VVVAYSGGSWSAAGSSVLQQLAEVSPPGDPLERCNGEPEEDGEERVPEEDVRHDEEEHAREGLEGHHPLVRWHEATVRERRDDREDGKGAQADPLANQHCSRAADHAEVD